MGRRESKVGMSWEEIGVSGDRGRLGWRQWLWGKYRRSAAVERRESGGQESE